MQHTAFRQIKLFIGKYADSIIETEASFLCPVEVTLK
nr:MAG TPA: hypothetical protein [Caudoviricetes sp.]DAK35054.1 MAG TPA: hypothetical protein [Caudoviricetes sp.]DAX20084.1 MAG TPA: hypothetical protein [Caudoviricetes sp.]